MAQSGRKRVIIFNGIYTGNFFQEARLPMARQDVNDTGFGSDDMTGVPGLRSSAYNCNGWFRLGDDGLTARDDVAARVNNAIGSDNDAATSILDCEAGGAVGDQAYIMQANQSQLLISAEMNGCVVCNAVFNTSGGVALGILMVSPFA